MLHSEVQHADGERGVRDDHGRRQFLSIGTGLLKQAIRADLRLGHVFHAINVYPYRLRLAWSVHVIF
jgi:hypothetical protein